jgi:carboxymethylenebutenolidase
MSDIQSKMINFPANGGSTPGFLAQPNVDGRFPGVVVIQEWWGLAPHIKEVAGRLAQAGYVALAPDLYHGQLATEPDEARKLAMALERDRAVAEILGAARYLQSLDEVAPRRIGVVGFCMGGGLAASAAAESRGELGAAVMFYGRPLDPKDTAKLQVPLLGLFGELDQGIPVEGVRAFAQELEAHGKTHEIHIYPEAQHAFFNDGRPHMYHAEAAVDAWEKTLAWFEQYLV